MAWLSRLLESRFLALVGNLATGIKVAILLLGLVAVLAAGCGGSPTPGAAAHTVSSMDASVLSAISVRVRDWNVNAAAYVKALGGTSPRHFLIVATRTTPRLLRDASYVRLQASQLTRHDLRLFVSRIGDDYLAEVHILADINARITRDPSVRVDRLVARARRITADKQRAVVALVDLYPELGRSR
jgi:hypothetical protein